MNEKIYFTDKNKKSDCYIYCMSLMHLTCIKHLYKFNWKQRLISFMKQICAILYVKMIINKYFHSFFNINLILYNIIYFNIIL